MENDSWADHGTPMSNSDFRFSGNLSRYFLHGFIFSLVQFSLVIAIVLAMILSVDYSFLFSIAGILLILCFIVILFSGVLNSILANWIWNLQVKHSITSYCGQSILLYVMFPIIGPFYFFSLSLMILGIPVLIAISSTMIIISFVVSSFVVGYIGKYIAVEFEPKDVGREELASISERQHKCPRCGIYYNPKSKRISFNGNQIICPRCGYQESVPPTGPEIDEPGSFWD